MHPCVKTVEATASITDGTITEAEVLGTDPNA